MNEDTEIIQEIHEAASVAWLKIKREEGCPNMASEDENLVLLGFRLGFMQGADWGYQKNQEKILVTLEELKKKYEQEGK